MLPQTKIKYSISVALSVFAISITFVDIFVAKDFQYSSRFYDRKSEGWFWYEDPLVIEAQKVFLEQNNFNDDLIPPSELMRYIDSSLEYSND